MQCCVHVQTYVLQLAWLVIIRAILDLLIGERSRGFYGTFVEPLIMLYVIMAGT
jgi:hypothetical protein